MINTPQEASLLSGGDCFLHWHSQDRVMTHDSLTQLQQIASVLTATGDVTVNDQTDYIYADTTLQNIIVALPLAKNGREVEIIKAASAFRVLIVPTGSDTVLGAEGAIIQSRFDALRLKAIQDIGWVAI